MENAIKELSDEYVPPTPIPIFPDNQSVERKTYTELFAAVTVYVSRERIHERLYDLLEDVESCPNDVICDNIVLSDYTPSGPQTTNT